MSQKNVTKFGPAGFTEARAQIEEIAARLGSLEEEMREVKIASLEVAYFANFTEALRRLHVFASDAEWKLLVEKLRKCGVK